MIKAVIIAGGNGVRMQPLTSVRPKPLLKVADRTILEHNLDQLQGLVKEVIIVIGYRGDMIRSLIGDRYGKVKVNYVVQESQLGTGDAAKKAVRMIDDKFLLMNGDDIYFREDIKNCLKKNPSILLGTVKNPSSFGVVECHDDFVRSMIEKPENPSADALVNTGLYFLDRSIFDFKIEKSSRGELEFTDYIRALITEQRLYFTTTYKWMPVSYPWNLLEANEYMVDKTKRSLKGKIERGCEIIGNVEVESGALIKAGTRIEGPVRIGSGTTVGPNAFVRGNTIIGEDCRIGAGVEVKSSVIGNGTEIAHLTYVGDTIIGENCNIGGGTIIANFRLDKKNVKVEVKGKKVDSGRRKFGAVLGDRVNIGVNCSLMPGTMIGNDSSIGPVSMMKGSIGSDTTVFTRFEQVIKKNE